jgi:hypothetical protein
MGSAPTGFEKIKNQTVQNRRKYTIWETIISNFIKNPVEWKLKFKISETTTNFGIRFIYKLPRLVILTCELVVFAIE